MEVEPPTIIKRSLCMQCPNCGHKGLFSSPLKLRETCPLCFMKLQRGSGWFLGPMVVNYGFTVFVFVLPILGAALLDLLPMKPALIAIAVITVIMPILFYPYSWSLWFGIYYCFLPEELPANNKKFEHIDS
ncbi:MAG: DUF983 domain-containing protein [Verrucomicrobiota bacterium]